MRYTIAPPGKVPLRNTLFSLVDVPDLRALAELWPEAKTIWMGAGPVPEILHRGLIALAWLVRWRLVPSLSPLAPLMHWVMNQLRWGEHRGGMFVEVDGRGARRAAVKRSWHLLAEGDDGPLIPAMAVEALVRKTLDGQAPAPGARAAVRDLELDDYEALFAGETIYTGFGMTAADSDQPLYERCSATPGIDCPTPIRAHAFARWNVMARAAPASNAATACLAGLPAALGRISQAQSPIFRLPCPFRAGRRRAKPGRAPSATHISPAVSSRAGPLGAAAVRAVRTDEFRHGAGAGERKARRWCCGAGAFSACRCRCGSARARIPTRPCDDGRFSFHVEISHPLTGLIVRYQGWLEPKPVPDTIASPASVQAV